MNWTKIIFQRAGPALIVLAAVAYLAVGWSAVFEAIVAWGTVLLAYMTFLSIQELRAQEERTRKVQRDREERERKERLLKEIMQWAVEVQNVDSQIADLHIIDSQTPREYSPFMVRSAVNTKTPALYIKLLARSEYVRAIVLNSFKELSEDFDAVVIDLASVGFVRSPSYARDSLEKQVKGKAAERIKELKGSGNQDNSHAQFDIDLANAINNLLFKIGGINSNL